MDYLIRIRLAKSIINSVSQRRKWVTEWEIKKSIWNASCVDCISVVIVFYLQFSNLRDSNTKIWRTVCVCAQFVIWVCTINCKRLWDVVFYLAFFSFFFFFSTPHVNIIIIMINNNTQVTHKHATQGQTQT